MAPMASSPSKNSGSSFFGIAGIAESNMETHVPSHLETEKTKKKEAKQELWP